MKKRADYRAAGAGILEQIGGRARDVREGLGYSYRDVQRLYGIPASTAHAFERGRVDSAIIAEMYQRMGTMEPEDAEAGTDTSAAIPTCLVWDGIASEIVDHVRASTIPIGVVECPDGPHTLAYPAGAENLILSVRAIKSVLHLVRCDGEDYVIERVDTLYDAIVAAMDFYYKERLNTLYGMTTPDATTTGTTPDTTTATRTARGGVGGSTYAARAVFHR